MSEGGLEENKILERVIRRKDEKGFQTIDFRKEKHQNSSANQQKWDFGEVTRLDYKC